MLNLLNSQLHLTMLEGKIELQRHMRTCYLLLIISLLLTFCSCDEKKPQENFNSYESLYMEGRFSKAQKAIDKVIAKDSTSAFLYNARGMNNLQLNEFDAAIVDFTKALELEDENIFSLTKRGEAKARKNDNNNAIEDYKKAIVLKGFKPVADSIFDYKVQHVELFVEPLLFDIVYLRGIAYYDIYELFLAYDDFNLCIEASLNASIESKFDKIPECYYWRGLTFKERNEINLACADLEIAAESGVTEALKYIEEICK